MVVQTDRQTDRQTQTYRDTDGQTDRETHTQIIQREYWVFRKFGISFDVSLIFYALNHFFIVSMYFGVVVLFPLQKIFAKFFSGYYLVCAVLFVENFNRRQMISIESATTPHSFNSLLCAGANLGVLAFKISVLRLKLVIICATRACGSKIR